MIRPKICQTKLITGLHNYCTSVLSFVFLLCTLFTPSGCFLYFIIIFLKNTFEVWWKSTWITRRWNRDLYLNYIFPIILQPYHDHFVALSLHFLYCLEAKLITKIKSLCVLAHMAIKLFLILMMQHSLKLFYKCGQLLSVPFISTFSIACR